MKFGTFGDSECPLAETATFEDEQIPERGDGSEFQGHPERGISVETFVVLTVVTEHHLAPDAGVHPP